LVGAHEHYLAIARIKGRKDERLRNEGILPNSPSPDDSVHRDTTSLSLNPRHSTSSCHAALRGAFLPQEKAPRADLRREGGVAQMSNRPTFVWLSAEYILRMFHIVRCQNDSNNTKAFILRCVGKNLLCSPNELYSNSTSLRLSYFSRFREPRPGPRPPHRTTLSSLHRRSGSCEWLRLPWFHDSLHVRLYTVLICSNI
jgi:hypothetical protein